MKTWTAAVLLATTAVFGQSRENKLPADAAAALVSGTKFVLYSLSPGLLDADPFAPPQSNVGKKALPERERLHLFEILGQTELKNGEDRKAAVALLHESIRKWDGAVAACFHPRHALRVTHQGVVFDFVICFECRTIQLYRDSEQYRHVNIMGKPDKLDQILKKAGVPLPAPAPQ